MKLTEIESLTFTRQGTEYHVEVNTFVDGDDFETIKRTNTQDLYIFKGTNAKLRALKKVAELATI